MSVYERILCATDGTDRPRSALVEAGRLAGAIGSEVHVVTIPPALLRDELITSTERERVDRVEREMARLVRLDRVRVAPHLHAVGQGCVARQVAQLAEEIDADLIVVGSRGRRVMISALRGSLAQRLPQLTHRPVFVVHTDRAPTTSARGRLPITSWVRGRT